MEKRLKKNYHYNPQQQQIVELFCGSEGIFKKLYLKGFQRSRAVGQKLSYHLPPQTSLISWEGPTGACGPAGGVNEAKGARIGQGSQRSGLGAVPQGD